LQNFSKDYFDEVATIAARMDFTSLDKLALGLSELKGKLFIAGLGGSAANASHAAADFRKITDIQAICLSDNVAEITARANDEGWQSIYADQMNGGLEDALLVLSVGGGKDGVSLPLIKAIDKARSLGMFIYGIVGRDGGYTKEHADCAVVIPTVAQERITPHTESFQSVVLHYLVSHPAIQKRQTKW
jgi:D-sedoheptulose 7-phosphate isomerase